MVKPFRTVKTRITALMVCFVLIITAVVVLFSVHMMGDFRTRTVTQSAEFNMKLVADAIERDLVELVALANWCSFATNASARYLAGEYSSSGAMQAFNRLQEEVRNSRMSRYVDRIMVVDMETARALHTGTNTSNTRPFTKEGVSVLNQWILNDGAWIYDITLDPFSRAPSEVINILAPVYSPIDFRAIGRVYLAASTAVVTDKLRGYQLSDGASLYLTIHENLYQITSEKIIPVAEMQQVEGALPSIDCEVRRGITLTHVFGRKAAIFPLEGWLWMLLGICALILLLAAVLTIMLNLLISRPVARIRQKIEEISAGDFSQAPQIESDSEIGAVGQGINQLSRNVVELMESRVADEKHKREVEYRMLQSQVNPHFLYNTLGAIKWMATLQKADGIAEMTTALSRLLKTVAKDMRKVVPLREEINLLEDYYVILRYRYGSALVYEKQIESESLLDSLIPRFVLQPLMENAIFHGIEPKGNGHITLSIRSEGADVYVAMEDDGVGMDAQRIAMLLSPETVQDDESAYSLGIRSVHARIVNVFGPDYGLGIESEVDRYTRMIIRVPRQFEEGDVK